MTVVEKEKQRARVSSRLAWLVTLVLAAYGCSHSRDKERWEAGLAGVYAAQVPRFLNGPMSALLTNSAGFTARVSIETDSFTARDGFNSGELFYRSGRLLFAPTQAQNKKVRTGGFAFLWNVGTSSGYVLSGALEGYAPVSSSVHATNIVTQGRTTTEKLEGHPAVREIATVQMDDGSSTSFQVWRASDLNGAPLRIIPTESGIPMTLSLAEIRVGAPPEDAFALPDEFRKYSSPEAMADEIMARQHNLHRKSTGGLDSMDPINPRVR